MQQPLFLYDFILPLTIKTLEYSTMLAVNRENPYSLFCSKLHNNVSCCYKCLLICKGNILTRIDSLNSRNYSHHADNRSDNNLRLFHCSCMDKSVHPCSVFYSRHI